MDKIGVALFGLGRIGKIHLRNLISNKRINLVWIVEQDNVAVEEVLQGLGVNGTIQIANIANTDAVIVDSRL
jgi:glyceraldehyde-3-phosphate dehydrogenase/erythrose-4-phosphate dehydrogenase